MKRKVRKKFDSTEFFLLVFVVVIMLAYFGIQTGLLPKFFSDSVLGIATP